MTQNGRPQLVVLNAGPGVTLQDEGRRGLLRYGVTTAGPMDPLAFATANWIAGNPVGSTAVEVSQGGIDLACEGGEVGIAFAGGHFQITLDEEPMPPSGYVTLRPGSRLSIRAGESGGWCYLAPCVQLDVEPVLNSLSTHVRSGIGGLNGKALAAGDRIGIATSHAPAASMAKVKTPWLLPTASPIRVVLGPQDDYFAADEIAKFLDGPWKIGARGDRMAYFLEGPVLTHVKGYNIVSDGIAMGAIQIPGNGQPIVLMADRQPTGGYPKIATIIGSDIGRFAQARAGESVHFTSVHIDEAVAIRRRVMDVFSSPPRLDPIIRRNFPARLLLSSNLVDGYFPA
jgi:biotin-dependent carboxylase-like uncharacterized protein